MLHVWTKTMGDLNSIQTYFSDLYTFFYLFVFLTLTHAGPIDYRWNTVPDSNSYIFSNGIEIFKWTFRDQSYDKAEVTVIHAPPNLHYEYSVVSEDVEIRGPPQTLRVYYHLFIGRVNVTYHSNTITLTITNSSITDIGEIFVQVNFPGQVPLTSSTFLNIYEEPRWTTEPERNVSCSLKDDVAFTLVPAKLQYGPPLDNVVVYFTPKNYNKRQDGTNGTMTITPPGKDGSLIVTCQPSTFHRHLRYLGDASLQDMQFLIPNITEAQCGNYEVSMEYGVMNFTLKRTVQILCSGSETVHVVKVVKPTAACVSGKEDIFCIEALGRTERRSLVAVSVSSVVILVLTGIIIVLGVRLYKMKKDISYQSPAASENV